MFINMCKHEIKVQQSDGTFKVIPPSGKVARCSQQSTIVSTHLGVDLIQTTFGEVEDLPEPSEGVLLIVSGMVRTALPNRKDLVSPGDMLRDEKGNVTGCNGFNCN